MFESISFNLLNTKYHKYFPNDKQNKIAQITYKELFVISKITKLLIGNDIEKVN